MDLNRDVCYRALKTRDARFDGRFFTGVTSTGVYCRPVCPARTPRRLNCRFFASAAAATMAGFRPCLRCRPETSPGTPAWVGSSATVTRALRLIGEGALVGAGVEALADRLGIGARHLRRLFAEHLGATPVMVERTRRIHFAKKLLDETDLPITQVAFSAGFNSVRRFNGAIRDVYDRTPRELRKRADSGAPLRDVAAIRLRLGFRPPFDWEQVVAFLAPRAIPGVEKVTADAYCRSVAVGDYCGFVRVTLGTGDWLVLETAAAAAPELMRIAAGMRAMFDLGADPAVIAEQLAGDRIMKKLTRRRPGLRVPGTWDPFEMAVRAIIGQQVTVRGATTVAGRLVQRYGVAVETGCGGVDRVFPPPAVLARADIEGLGMPKRRAGAVRNLARAVARDGLLLDGLRGLDASVEALGAIAGLGPWTANYIAMRALREPDAFPDSDLGLLRAVARLNGGVAPTPARLRRRAEAWRPWRAYAAMHLWTSLDGATDSSASETSPAARTSKR